MSSAAPKKKSFDRGGPVWPPRSNVTNDRLRGGSGGALPPQPKIGGSGGQRPPAKIFDGPGSHFLFLKFLNKDLHCISLYDTAGADLIDFWVLGHANSSFFHSTVDTVLV